MKIKYNLDYGDNMYLNIDDFEYELYAGDEIDIKNNIINTEIRLYTKKDINFKFWRIMLLFFGKLICGIFKLLIMDVPGNWIKSIDPYIIYAKYNLKSDYINIKYIPGRITKDMFKFISPKLLINGELIDLNMSLCLEKIKFGYLNFCLDLISIWVYSCIPLGIIFISSRLDILKSIILISIMLVISVPVVFKLLKEYNNLKRIMGAANKEN